MKKLLILSIAILALSGCFRCNGITTAIWVDANIVDFKTESGIVKLPTINSISVADIGDTMVSTFISRKKVLPALILNEDITHIGKHCGNPVQLSASKGSYWLGQKNEEGQFFFAENNNITIEVAEATKTYDPGLSWSSAASGIFIPNDKKQSAGIFWGQPIYGPNWFTMEPISIIDVKIAEKTKWLPNSAESFKRELVYNGKSENTIFILYREFVDNMARPSFSTEIKYDLTDTKLIGYKNARFEVIDATNMSIQYKVLKHLE